MSVTLNADAGGTFGTIQIGGVDMVKVDNAGNISSNITPGGTATWIPIGGPNGTTLPSYTVSTLPTGSIGMLVLVTDATSPTFLGTLTGGGAVTCIALYNGTAWVSA